MHKLKMYPENFYVTFQDIVNSNFIINKVAFTGTTMNLFVDEKLQKQT